MDADLNPISILLLDLCSASRLPPSVVPIMVGNFASLLSFSTGYTVRKMPAKSMIRPLTTSTLMLSRSAATPAMLYVTTGKFQADHMAWFASGGGFRAF
ncbi:hypothetical protein KXD40_004124 [Peronospora effusa]|uniref:Uncharacterized protein n=1 Tax=Peronospora effusa TaxID=542832 RepID=A0A3R7XW74_9STRA|nr:hypothetical protein DD237_003600 [Peronospora effusa]UIZ28065.1 hypothetical protein KXD40_004124 [Peronospora effusa]